MKIKISYSDAERTGAERLTSMILRLMPDLTAKKDSKPEGRYRHIYMTDKRKSD